MCENYSVHFIPFFFAADLSVTDLSANSRYPLVVSRQHRNSSLHLDMSWIEPVTVGGLPSTPSLQPAPSPVRLLLPHRALTIESALYVVRASSLRVVVAVPFLLQLKQYMASVRCVACLQESNMMIIYIVWFPAFTGGIPGNRASVAILTRPCAPNRPGFDSH